MVASQRNSADAKMERTLSKIFDQYGFKESGQLMIMSNGPEYLADYYLAKGLTADEVDRISRTIEVACQGCTVSSGTRFKGSRFFDISDSYQTITDIIVSPSADGPDSVSGITVSIHVGRRSQPFWGRVKSWWPW